MESKTQNDNLKRFGTETSRPIAATISSFVLLLLIIGNGINAAAGQSPVEGSSRWHFDNAVVRLKANGNTRHFAYEKLPPELSFIPKGSVVFDGKRVGGTYDGVFTTYSKECGTVSFHVAGSIAADQRSVTLKGAVPTLDRSCKEIGKEQEVALSLTFFENVSETASYPDWIEAKEYFVDQRAKTELIFDGIKDGTQLTATLVQFDGTKLADVTALSVAPRRLRLQFSYLNPTHNITGEYWFVTDKFDSVQEAPLFPTRLEKITSGDDLPSSFSQCSNDCPLHPAEDIFNRDLFQFFTWDDAHYTSAFEGVVCVKLRSGRLADVIQFLRTKQLNARVGNSDCGGNGQAIAVPTGWERWTLDSLDDLKTVASADYAYGPLGGSGTVRMLVKDETFFPADADAERARSIWEAGACRLKSALNRFRTVLVDHCRRSSGRLDEGLCFSVTLEGHTGDTGKKDGFSTIKLNRILDDKFLVHSELEFDVVPLEVGRFGSSEFAERLVFYVMESKFAREPVQQSAERAAFKEIENFQIGKSSREVDEVLVGVVQQLVMTSDLSCSK